MDFSTTKKAAERAKEAVKECLECVYGLRYEERDCEDCNQAYSCSHCKLDD